MSKNDKAETNIVIELKRPTRYDLIEGVVLLPGENNVPKAAWDKCKAHHMVKVYIAEGHIVERGPGKARPIADQLGTVSPNKARQWIDATSDVGQLLRWRDQETRSDIRTYLDSRIETVRNGAQKQEPVKQSQGGDDEDEVFDS